MIECRKRGCSSIIGGAENKKEEEGWGARVGRFRERVGL